jgi:hypothetical protein
MPQIIERPPYLANAASQFVSDLQVRRLQDSIDEYNDRKKQQRNTAIGVGAIAGGIGGLAVGGASLAAGGAYGIPALATATIPTSAIIPGLTGAALGGQIGQQLAGEDYAGALGTAASAAQLGTEYVENQRTYGYQPSRDEKAMFARAAFASGSNLGAVREFAQQKGITVPAALQRIQDAHGVRQGELEAESAALKQKAVFEQTRRNLAGPNGPLEIRPNERTVKDINAEYDRLNGQIEAFYQSGGTAGRDPSEYNGRFAELSVEMAKAMQSDIGLKKPVGSVQPLGGQSRSAAYNTWNEVSPGFWERTSINADGSEHTITKGDPPSQRPPIRVQRADGTTSEIAADVYEGPNGTVVREGFSVKEPPLTAAQKQQADLMKSLNDALAKGEIDTQGAASIIRQSQNFALIEPTEAAIGESFKHVGAGTNTIDRYTALTEQARVLYGDALLTDPGLAQLKNMLIAIGDDAKANTAKAMAAQMQMGPPAPPPVIAPPGSAASAESGPESAGRGAARAIKATPGAIAAIPKAGFKAAGAGAKGITEAAVGFVNELAGIPPKGTPAEEYARQFADTQKRNIEAGINDTVVAIDSAGRVRPYEKSQVTAEVIAELKAQGFIFPGLD